MNPLDKETFSFWVTHPEELIPSDFQQLQEAVTAYPYCQSLYTMAAKAASVHQKGHAVEYIRQAAAHALSRNALRKLIENEFHWSENLLSRLNELSLKHVPIPDDYQQESYEVFKRRIEENRTFPTFAIFDFTKPDRVETPVSLPEAPVHWEEPAEIPPVPPAPVPELPVVAEIPAPAPDSLPLATEPDVQEPDLARQQQMTLIDEFIKRAPMIKRARLNPNEVPEQEDLTRHSTSTASGPVTESFAKILATQGKLDRAIDIYQRLIVKNPEKKVYFAEKIEALKARQAQ